MSMTREETKKIMEYLNVESLVPLEISECSIEHWHSLIGHMTFDQAYETTLTFIMIGIGEKPTVAEFCRIRREVDACGVVTNADHYCGKYSALADMILARREMH